MSQIRMFIQFANKRQFEIPVIPEEISVADGAEVTRWNVLGLGEVGDTAFRKPQQISFTSFFPYLYDPTYCQYPNLLHPVDACDLFTRALVGTVTSGKPDIVHFTMIEEYENGLWATWISDDFAIESFVKAHKANELVDQYYTLSLKTLRVPKLQSIGSVDDPNTNKPKHTPSTKTTEEDGTKSGDTASKFIRIGISPVNIRLQNGSDVKDVTSPIGTSPYDDYAIPGTGVLTDGVSSVYKDGQAKSLGNTPYSTDPSLNKLDEDVVGRGVRF